MPIPTFRPIGRRALQVVTVGTIALGAVALGGCRDSDDGFNPNGLGVDATVTGVAATLQSGENQRPETPDFPPKIDEAARFAEEHIRADFADRDWIDALVEIKADDAAMVMVMDRNRADLSEEDLDEACTALGGEAYSDEGFEPVVVEARVEDLDGNVLKVTDGPQCSPS